MTIKIIFFYLIVKVLQKKNKKTRVVGKINLQTTSTVIFADTGYGFYFIYLFLVN